MIKLNRQDRRRLTSPNKQFGLVAVVLLQNSLPTLFLGWVTIGGVFSGDWSPEKRSELKAPTLRYLIVICIFVSLNPFSVVKITESEKDLVFINLNNCANTAFGAVF